MPPVGPTNHYGSTVLTEYKLLVNAAHAACVQAVRHASLRLATRIFDFDISTLVKQLMA